MALQKVTYISEETVISAENLNDIQDAIIKVEDTVDKGVVPTARTINGKPLSTDISLSANDVGAAPSGYGIGSSAKSIGDVNDATVGGVYYYGSTASNIPDGFGNGVIFVQNRADAQIFQRISDIYGLVAERIRQSNGTWGEWKRCDPSAFAPAGYGLGGGQYTTDFNTCLANGWYWGNSATANAPSGFTTNCSCFVIARTASQVYQYFQHPSNGSVLQRYTKDGGATWFEEWVNPPMTLGVEYRTTERWNGKAVYTKLIDFGALPNASSKTVATNVPTTYVVRSEHVIHSSDGKVIQSPYFLANGTLVVKHLVTGSGIQITTTADYSGYIATFQIWYTKEDWK